MSIIRNDGLIKFFGEDIMRRMLFALVLLVALSPDCGADLFTITFDGLQDGQTLTNYTSQGYQVSDPAGLDVIGPGNPNYLGATGLEPSKNDWFVTKTDGLSWTLYSLGFSLGLVGTPGAIQFDVFGIEGGVTEYIILVDTTYYGFNFELPQTGLPPVDELRISMNNSVPPFQVTEIVLGLASEGLTSLPVPEPSSWIAFSIGGMALTMWWMANPPTSFDPIAGPRHPTGESRVRASCGQWPGWRRSRRPGV